MTLRDFLVHNNFIVENNKYSLEIPLQTMIFNGMPQRIMGKIEIEFFEQSYEILEDNTKKFLETLYIRVYQNDKLGKEIEYLMEENDSQWLLEILNKVL